MLTLFAAIHLVIGIALIMFVLLQDSKGSAMGAFGGGSSSNSFFGSSGASNFLSTTTRWLAIAFAVSCLLLTYLTSRKAASVMDQVPAATAPVPTDQAPAATTPPSTPTETTAPTSNPDSK